MLAIFWIVCLVALLAGLFHLQILMHERYSIMSEDNRLKLMPLMAPRGTVFDRNGVPIAKDTLSFDVSIVYRHIKDKDEVANGLSSILGIPDQEIKEKINAARYQPYKPVRIASDVGLESAVQVEEAVADYPGVVLEVSSKREYIYGNAAANVMGYLGRINRSEFERLKPYGYRVDDLVGRDGIEKYYDEYLRGRHGGKQVEVDHRGREVRVLGLKEPSAGKDLYLTLDIELQRYCDSLLEGKKGAIIALDPATGRILAMSSAPAYDPGIFVDSQRSQAVVSEILIDKDYPLMNRAISGAYPPGSVFKIVIATAGLEEGVITVDTAFTCTGAMTLGKRDFHCWREGGHGVQTIVEALKNSCNVFFWRLGLGLEVERIAKYAGRFGAGARTGIDLPGESKGVLPTEEWKQQRFNEKWYRGETMNYSVGQGYLVCTPIQVARMMAVFANGGYLVRPHVVSEVGGIPLNTEGKEDLGISESTYSLVREGLKKVVNDRYGTGMKAKQKDFIVSGKTGTAQTSRGMSHGWFAGFAPFDEPKMVVLVFDEYGGRGGYYAAGTAGKVFEKAKDLGMLE